MEWDTVKENLQPATQGRKPAALAAALGVIETCPGSDGTKKAEDERRYAKHRKGNKACRKNMTRARALQTPV